TLEAQVRVPLAEAPGAHRIVEGGIHQVLVIRCLAEAADAGDERGALEHRRHRDPGIELRLRLPLGAGKVAAGVEAIVPEAGGDAEIGYPELAFQDRKSV